MTIENYKNLNCPIAESLSVLGDQWTLLIIRDALMGVSSFSGFTASLGISKRMLSRRLGEMIEDGLLLRVPARPGAARQKYVPTQKAQELAMVMSSLIAWGEKWYPGKCGERYLMQDRESGAKIAPGMVITGSKIGVDLADCDFLPGPGASLEQPDQPEDG